MPFLTVPHGKVYATLCGGTIACALEQTASIEIVLGIDCQRMHGAIQSTRDGMPVLPIPHDNSPTTVVGVAHFTCPQECAANIQIVAAIHRQN